MSQGAQGAPGFSNEHILGRILGQLEGINKRLDISNGTLKEHGERLEKIDIQHAEVRGALKTAQVIAGTGAFGALWLAIKIFFFGEKAVK